MARASTESTIKSREPHIILGVAEDASEERVRSAYKALALKWHPDRQLDNYEEATAMFAEINKAHRTMLRNIRRAHRSSSSTPSSSVAGSSPSSPESTTSSLPSEPRSRPSCDPSSTSPKEAPQSSTPSCPVSKEGRKSSKTATSKTSSKSRSPRNDKPRGRSTSRSSSSHSENSTSSKLSKPNPKPSSRANAPSASSSTHRPPRSRLHKQSSCRPEPISEGAAPKDSPPCNLTTPSANLGPEHVEETLHPIRSILRSSVADVPKRWTHTLDMTLEEIHHGKTFHFRIVRYKRSGRKTIVPLDLYVPPGTRGGTEIVVDDAGNERKDGSWQAIVFLVKEMKHERFRRAHNDLMMDVRLPWADSLNEEIGQVYFHAVDGKEYKIKVPYCKDGLLSGTAVIPGAGLPSRSGDGRGRVIIHWEISSPSSSWDALKNVLRFKG